MIDLLLAMAGQALQVVSVMVLVLVAVSILVGVLAEPVSHTVTDDWERRNIGRSR